ncbi:MAG: phage tail tape measure protein [Planctomycetota bacterium]
MKSAGAIRAGRAFVELFADDSRMSKDLKRARGKLTSFARHANQIGRTMVAAFVAIAAPIALATNAFAGFEDQMAEVRAVTQATTGDFAKLNDQAKLLGRTTSFTASQVASAQAELGRAGFDPDDILKSTSSVLDLSRATKAELSEAASIAADSLRGFRLEAAQMPRVVDVLTATTINSSQGLGDLFEAMKLVAPVAADVGMSIENTAAAIGILANNGIKGSMAGTALKRAMLNLADPAIRKKLEDLTGVLAVDDVGDLRNIAQVIAEIGEKTRSLPNADRVSIFAELFGDRAVVAASNLANADAKFGDLLKTLEESQGVAAKTAEMMDQTFGGSLRRMWSAVEGVAIAIGEKLTPYLVVAVDWFSDVANRVTVLITENEGLVIAVTATVAAIGATGAALMAAGTAAAATAAGITAVTATAKVLAPTMKALQVQAILMETTLTGLIAKQVAWNAAMLAGKAALAGLVAVGVYKLTQEITGLRKETEAAARALDLAREKGEGLTNSLTRKRRRRQEAELEDIKQIEDPQERKQAIDAAVKRAQKNQAGIAQGIQQQQTVADNAAKSEFGGTWSEVTKDAFARVAELQRQKEDQDEFVNDLLKLQAEANRGTPSAPDTQRPQSPGGPTGRSDYDVVADALTRPFRIAGDELGKQIKRQLPAWMTGPNGITVKQGINAVADLTNPWKATRELQGRFAGHGATNAEQAMEQRRQRFAAIGNQLTTRQVALSSAGAFGSLAAQNLQLNRTVEQNDFTDVKLDSVAMEYLRGMHEALTKEPL